MMSNLHFKFKILFLLLLIISSTSLAQGVELNKARKQIDFNRGWSFSLYPNAIDSLGGINEDSHWKEVTLPHDWSIEGEFSEAHPAGAGGGALPGGLGYYIKNFDWVVKDGKRVFIDFDGVYMNSEVILNGVTLGKRPNGYVSFRYEMSSHLKNGKNSLIVKVDNSKQPNSRWYSGSGIYRNVWIVETNEVNIDHWGTYVTTPSVSEDMAMVNVETKLNHKFNLSENKCYTLKSSIVDFNGKCISVNSVECLLKNKGTTVQQEFEIDFPNLWSIDMPNQYLLVSELFHQGQLVDNYETRFGIRQFSFDAQKGFELNHSNVKLKGVCLHHDLGCLGAAFNTSAATRQLQRMKDMGCNAIRCTHNPPAPEFLELCDNMGFVVINEAFDMWRKRKTSYDYSLYFDKWHEQDLTDIILRDRNHPSVFVWSIGNEVLEQWSNADADTLDIQQANLLLNLKRSEASMSALEDSLSLNSLLTIRLAEIVRGLDDRPITTGNNEASPNNHLFRANTLDIIGFNYQHDSFDSVPKNFPGKPFIITESTSALMTRGYYKSPSDSMFIWPERWDVPFYDSSYSCSSYDNCHVPWGTTHEYTWDKVKHNEFISGMFVWTGFDYLGEPTPYWWPARSSFFGIVDLAGFPKDIYYMYQSEWSDKSVLHLFPHWNWQPGDIVDLWCYYNNADEVELFLNEKSLGIKSKKEHEYHLKWSVPFESGKLLAISRKNGKEVLRKEINTAQEAYSIRLTTDTTSISATNRDLCFITIEVVDKDGNLCPNATDLIDLKLVGNGKIVGVDNGNPISHASFKNNNIEAFYGKCMVVIECDKSKNNGTIRLTAKSGKLKSNKLKIHTLK